jgi:hypothetical protein
MKFNYQQSNIKEKNLIIIIKKTKKNNPNQPELTC